MNRRDSLKASVGGLAAGAIAPSVAVAQAESQKDPAPFVQYGRVFASEDNANPFGVSKAAFNVVSPDLEASKRFYRDCLEYSVVDEGTIAMGQSEAPGIGSPGRKYVSLAPPGGRPGAVVMRVLEAPPGAIDNRPRPTSTAIDPGLLVIEQGTRDPAESYMRMKSFNTPTITPPKYYLYRNTNADGPSNDGRDFDVMSYTAFGPGGEQLFTTAQVASVRREWTADTLHSGFGGTSVTSLNQVPVLEFYEKALGMRQTTLIGSYQHNNNDLVGVPRGSFHTWSQVAGLGEVWQYWAEKGTCYPTSLARKGLAMLTMQVKDYAKVKKMCADNRIRTVGEGALPLPGRTPTEGFYIRGAVGELLEVIPA
jgi:catechol 2,3-dioxygenase-like lactoylglutathione lyase family enzyme